MQRDHLMCHKYEKLLMRQTYALCSHHGEGGSTCDLDPNHTKPPNSTFASDTKSNADVEIGVVWYG